jgi:hypothetical protein
MIKALVFSPFISREIAFMLVTHSPAVRAVAAAVVTACLAVPLLAQNQPAQAPKLKDYEKKELHSLDAVLDAALTGNLPEGPSIYAVDPSKKTDGIVRASDAPTVTWYHDAFRASDNRTLVPFMLVFDASQLQFSNLALGVRVVPKGTTTVSTAKGNGPAYPWNERYFTQLRPAGDMMPNAQKVARSFLVGPGDYDVYVAVRPHSLEKVKEAPFKALVFRQPVTVPDLTTPLITSSVMLLDSVKDVASPAQASDDPWLMGSLQLTPSLDRQFAKTQALSVLFWVYGMTVQEGKPDVTIDYSFFRKQGAEEKYFNKTAPQNFNASTLPAQWTDKSGLTGYLGEVPLTTFEPGDYRLEIKIKDNLAKTTITRDIAFSVTGA